MARRAPLLLLVLLARCSKEPAPPAPPTIPVVTTPAGEGLLPADTFLYIEATSPEAIGKTAPWAKDYHGRRLRTGIERTFGIPADLLDEQLPLAFALAGPTPEDCYGIVIVPVRDADSACKAAAAHGATAHAGAHHVGVCADARYAPGKSPITADLPQGILRGHVDPAPFVRSLRRRAPPGLLDKLFAWLDTLGVIAFGVEPEGSALRLDVTIPMPLAGEARPPDLRAALSRLPGDAPVVVAEDIDVQAFLAWLKPMLPPGFDDPVPALVSAFGNGFAGSLSLSASGVEGVVVRSTKDPAHFGSQYIEEVKRQTATLGERLALTDAPDSTVDGVTMPAFHVRLVPAEYPTLFGVDRSYVVFRIEAPGPGAPADWAQRDRAAAERRLKRLLQDEWLDIRYDDEYLMVSSPESSIDSRTPALTELALAGRGEVRIRLAVDPDHPSYAAYRRLLDAALDREGAATAGTIPASARTPRDVETGEFQDGLRWCPIAADAEARMPRAFKYRGRLLVAEDQKDLSQADVRWAWVSEAREGANADTRDVAYRLKEESVWRAQAITRGTGVRYVAALIDGEAAAGARLDDLHGECEDFKNLSPWTAERLALLMTEAPFHGFYVPEGVRPESFYWNRQEEAGLKKVFGEKGMMIRAGAVGDQGFVVFGGDAVASKVIAKLREANPAPPPQLLDALAVAPDAAFLARVDISRLVGGYREIMDAMMPPAFREDDVVREHPFPEIEPAVLAVWRAEPGLHLRLRVDGRLFEHFLHERERSEAEFATWKARSLCREIRLWRYEHGTDRLPAAGDFDEYAINDPWGVPQRIEATETGFRIVGAGADGEFGTDDDVVVDGEAEDD